MNILWKSSVLFYPKLHFRHSYNFEKLQRTFFLIDSDFFRTKKQRIYGIAFRRLINDKQEPEMNY